MANIQALGAAAGLGSANRDTLSDEMKQCNDSLEALLSSYEAILAHSRSQLLTGPKIRLKREFHLTVWPHSLFQDVQFPSRLYI